MVWKEYHWNRSIKSKVQCTGVSRVNVCPVNMPQNFKGYRDIFLSTCWILQFVSSAVTKAWVKFIIKPLKSLYRYVTWKLSLSICKGLWNVTQRWTEEQTWEWIQRKFSETQLFWNNGEHRIFIKEKLYSGKSVKYM